jgi:membrane protein implicated in regulation of membrane protease activity
MMDYSFMQNMMGNNTGMMFLGMWISWILFVVLSVLAILALLKYLRK